MEEIYGLKSSGRYQNTRRVYQQTYQIYPNTRNLPVKPEKLVIEDSNAGFDFFASVCREADIECVSSGGKSNLARYLLSPANSSANTLKTTCIIADGAAIGPEMNLLYKAVSGNENLSLYLPESFEWLILKSGLIDGNAIQSILSAAYLYKKIKAAILGQIKGIRFSS